MADEEVSFVMVPVASSQINEVGYDAGSQTLRCRFKNGWLYEYDGVAAEAHQAMMQSPSVGSFFANQVKNVYTYRRVE